MPSDADIRQGQELIRTLAAEQDPSGQWQTKVAITGKIDAATVSATQVLLYLGEKVRKIPDGLHPLLQPATPSLWRSTLNVEWPNLMTYLRGTYPRGLTRAGIAAIATTVAVAAAFLLGLRQLARWEDRKYALEEDFDGDE